MNTPLLRARGLGKTFTVHARGGLQLPVFAGIDLELHAGECLALTGHSGCGKSTLLRCLYGNYGSSAGSIQVWHDQSWLELTQAPAREVLAMRRRSLGYVSQFLRVIPRVSTLDIVADPLRRRGMSVPDAREQAGQWLQGLNLDPRLWALPPASFSGGEQQRVNIAHGLISAPPILLLDEPTASLDADNRRVVVQLIQTALAQGAAVMGIFHDEEVRDALATRCLDVEQFRSPSP